MFAQALGRVEKVAEVIFEIEDILIRSKLNLTSRATNKATNYSGNHQRNK
jgi:hypothetical protein